MKRSVAQVDPSDLDMHVMLQVFMVSQDGPMLVSWHGRLWRTLQLGGTGAAKRSEPKGYCIMLYTSPASDSQTRLALAPDEAIPCAFVTFSKHHRITLDP